MKTEKLNYHLPAELIAQQPSRIRSESRLLVLNRAIAELTDSRFSRIGDFLRPGDCLVLNDTKVIPARFCARRKSGASLEGLFLAEECTGQWLVLLRGLRKVKVGERIILCDSGRKDYCQAEIAEKKTGGRCNLRIDKTLSAEKILDKIGFAPLPPYIKRADDPDIDRIDRIRYQTIYARKSGAVAAPTAGLHFTDGLIKKLKKNGICFAYVTLHVGAGTFKPITTENLEDHKIHKESFSLDEENANIINEVKEKCGRIIAVGTTSVRTLETIACDSRVKPASGQTNLFITPGYEFKLVDAIVTNFHLPKSSLLALVAAFAGLDNILNAYNHAVEQKYRFYSYGDAMLII